MVKNRHVIDDEIVIALTLLVRRRLLKRSIRPKRWHVRPYYKDRSVSGRFVRDIPELRKDIELFKETFRVTPEQFDYLLEILRDDLTPKRNTRPSDRIKEEERLYMTLEFLGSGTIFRHLASIYKCGKTTVRNVVSNTCRSICRLLKPIYMPTQTESQWLDISNDFNGKWQLPNCLGAIDGKHVEMKCPQKAGSIFYCHKGFHSIILMAGAGSDYQFLYTDVGAYGSEGDSTVFRDSAFGQMLMEEKLPLPSAKPFYGKNMPFYFVADDAFPLCPRIMKPFTGKGKGSIQDNENQFNYRLSRARRCVENAFGILTARFYCLAGKLPVGPDNAQTIVDACCVLHNYLLQKSTYYCPAGFADSTDQDGNFIEGKWRAVTRDTPTVLTAIPNQTNGRPPTRGVQMRNHIMKYVCSPQGMLKWQKSYA